MIFVSAGEARAHKNHYQSATPDWLGHDLDVVLIFLSGALRKVLSVSLKKINTTFETQLLAK
jgi:hypothetical protein